MCHNSPKEELLNNAPDIKKNVHQYVGGHIGRTRVNMLRNIYYADKAVVRVAHWIRASSVFGEAWAKRLHSHSCGQHSGNPSGSFLLATKGLSYRTIPTLGNIIWMTFKFTYFICIAKTWIRCLSIIFHRAGNLDDFFSCHRIKNWFSFVECFEWNLNRVYILKPLHLGRSPYDIFLT